VVKGGGGVEDDQHGAEDAAAHDVTDSAVTGSVRRQDDQPGDAQNNPDPVRDAVAISSPTPYAGLPFSLSTIVVLQNGALPLIVLRDLPAFRGRKLTPFACQGKKISRPDPSFPESNAFPESIRVSMCLRRFL